VRVLRDGGAGDWLVEWRGCYWAHATYAAALADACVIAAAHNERIIDNAREDVWGGAP
jgi:hypothetical protein